LDWNSYFHHKAEMIFNPTRSDWALQEGPKSYLRVDNSEASYRMKIQTDPLFSDHHAQKTTRRLIFFLLFLTGGVSTALWLSSVQFPVFERYIFSIKTLLGITLCASLTALNLFARWFRWHFLLRRFTRHLGTRDSLLIYFATLPAIVTPFCIGELVRIKLLKRRAPEEGGRMVWVWVSERVMDAAVLASFLMIADGSKLGPIIVPTVAVATFLLVHCVFLRRGVHASMMTNVGALLITILAWTLPIAALSTAVGLFEPITVEAAAEAFSSGTLLGGITGLPLGVFVTGSAMIHDLAHSGISYESAVVGVLIFRAGTVWFAVLLGLAILFLQRTRIAQIVRNEDDRHFDTLAPEYGDEIPEHVRTALLDKKVRFIERRLTEHGIPSGSTLGLDLGCGHGWYMAEITRFGRNMVGVDYSSIQLVQGSLHLRRENLPARMVHADAKVLPFADNSFDFAYSINALHHILGPGGQEQAIAEVVRVLKPGGVFLLHEINTQNPLFRFYMGYLFPLFRRIDEGNERWILPGDLLAVSGATWLSEVDYFTFIPDFVPGFIQKMLGRLERRLEESNLRRFSAHYQAVLIKNKTEH
jgi:SAM-dependent methyltransferase